MAYFTITIYDNPDGTCIVKGYPSFSRLESNAIAVGRTLEDVVAEHVEKHNRQVAQN